LRLGRAKLNALEYQKAVVLRTARTNRSWSPHTIAVKKLRQTSRFGRKHGQQFGPVALNEILPGVAVSPIFYDKSLVDAPAIQPALALNLERLPGSRLNRLPNHFG
jgi:hypothetical protein